MLLGVFLDVRVLQVAYKYISARRAEAGAYVRIHTW